MALQIVTYDPADRPDVQVQVLGHDTAPDGWYPGELRQWVQRDDGTWWANCSWRHDTSGYLDNFPTERVRLDDTDYARGRN